MNQKINHQNTNFLNILDRRYFLKVTTAGAAALALGAGCSRLGAAPKRKPNIIVLLSDDQGWGEVGVQWKDAPVPTPNQDSIARNGIRFSNGYVTCPVCAPSRIGLLIGRYQQRFGYEDHPNPGMGLPSDEVTLPEKLKTAGYATGMIGKWHLGDKPGITPVDRGFDEYYGFLGGGHTYLPDSKDKSPSLTGPIMRGMQEVKEEEYLTDAFAREAASFIERHRTEPFFLYVPFNAPHLPLEASQKYLDRFPNITNTNQKTYYAMLAALDDAVGCILDAIRKNDLEEDTMIFYFSDNGATLFGNNGPLRQGKGTTYEGGIRIPFLMQWKGVVPEGKVYEKPVISMDIHATALAAAGVTAPAGKPIDGVNLLPYVTGKNDSAPHDVLYWRYLEKRGFRKGDWKLVQDDMEKKETELYNLAEDVGEKNDLAKQMPEKLAELEKDYKVLDDQMEDPKYIHLINMARFKKEGREWPLKKKKQ